MIYNITRDIEIWGCNPIEKNSLFYIILYIKYWIFLIGLQTQITISQVMLYIIFARTTTLWTTALDSKKFDFYRNFIGKFIRKNGYQIL